MSKVSDHYKTLYHYTNYSGLLGILDSDVLRATHFKFLNDRSEIKLFMEDSLPDILYPHVFKKCIDLINSDKKKKQYFLNSGKSLEQIVLHETSVAIESAYNPLKEQIYIASFCGEHKDNNINRDGLLSQWRAYGRDGGFAIVFKTLEIEKCMNMEGRKFHYGYGSLSDVIYSHDEKKFKDELSESIDIFTNYVCELIDRVYSNGDEPSLDKDPYSAFLRCISRYKHRGFAEENEVRLVFHLYDEAVDKKSKKEKKFKKINYREKNGEQVPYINLFEFQDNKLPIEKIIVGPHREKESRAAFLRTKLKKTNIEIAVSEIPYVD